ncbi:PepSY domain-containing protein [Pseudoalteromonas sp. M58]|uniref:PepSY domain-containing protein n=1 Tax=Pseudoalteromonas sp. M58 TaxID=3141534 RepID=UPI0036720F5C
MRVLLILNLIAVFCLANVAHANNTNSTPDKIEISKKKAVILAKQTTDGTTLKISEETQFYTVRILKADGHVVDLKINKKTGEVKKD